MAFSEFTAPLSSSMLTFGLNDKSLNEVEFHSVLRGMYVMGGGNR